MQIPIDFIPIHKIGNKIAKNPQIKKTIVYIYEIHIHAGTVFISNHMYIQNKHTIYVMVFTYTSP